MGDSEYSLPEPCIHAVLVDEVGQIIEPIAVAPLSKAQRFARTILVGDPQQLPPSVNHRLCVDAGLVVSVCRKDSWTFQDCELPYCIEFNTQHRMAPCLNRFPNIQFYRSLIENANSIWCQHPPKIIPWDEETSAIVFTHTFAQEESSGTSYKNRRQADVVQTLVDNN